MIAVKFETVNYEDIQLDQNSFTLIINILQRFELPKTMSFLINDSIFRLQSSLLSKTQGLLRLFDRFEASSCFSVPEKEPSVSLDNITFGPDQYNIFINELSGANMRIIYFCVLYYIFQRSTDDEGMKLYQNLLRFINQNDLKLANSKLTIEDEQIKVYYAKFLNSLLRSKSKRKLIVEELSTLPQMNLLLQHLIQRLTKQQDLIIEINAYEIQSALKKQLGFSLQFLTNELFIMQGQYLVDIRYFNQNCCFLIRRDKLQNIQKLRHEIMVSESAFFLQQVSQGLQRHTESGLLQTKRKFKVTKKSTVKSIGLVSEGDCDDENQKLTRNACNFGGILPVDKTDHQEFFKETNSSEEVYQNCSIEDFTKVLHEGLSKKITSKRQQKVAGHKQSNQESNRPQGCLIDSLIFQVSAQDITSSSKENSLKRQTRFFKKIDSIDNSITFHTKGQIVLENQQSSKKSITETDLASSSLNSFTNSCKSLTKIKANGSKLERHFNFSYRRRHHKDSFPNHQKKDTFLGQSSLHISHSTKLIKSNGFDLQPQPRKTIKVPTFILNRQKAKQNLSTQLVIGQKSSTISKEQHRKIPTITFSYNSR